MFYVLYIGANSEFFEVSFYVLDFEVFFFAHSIFFAANRDVPTTIE